MPGSFMWLFVGVMWMDQVVLECDVLCVLEDV